MGEVRHEKTGPPVVVDHTLFYQVMGDEAFWDAAPAFSFLRRTCLATHRKIVDAIAYGKPVDGCLSCASLRPLVLPLLQSFAAHAARLQEDGMGDQLEPVVDYVSRRRGYRPREVVMYHKDEHGKTRKLVL